MGLRTKQVSSDGHGCTPTLLQAEAVKCPRCDSTNTKFCYYNNYNKSQPRYFCKTCKRHWTKGGTLRNVPVGGGRKNKRKASNTAGKTTSKINSSTTSTTITTTTTTFSGIRNNNIIVQAQEPRLSLPIAALGGVDEKNLFEEFYQTISRQVPCSMPNSFIDSTDGVLLGSTLSLPENDRILQIPYSNLGFESNPCSISSIQSPNLYTYTGEANCSEETVMNSINAAMSDHHHQQWSMATTTNSVIDMSTNWGWDDFDKFVSVEADLTVPWDDTEIKP